jgi:hypothetical protein
MNYYSTQTGCHHTLINTTQQQLVTRIIRIVMNCLMIGSFALMGSVSQAQVLWSSATGSAWLTGSNWTGGSVPTSTQIAQFGANPTSITSGVGINSNTNSNVQVGAIELTAAKTTNMPLIGNSSGIASGVLTLHGTTVNGVNNVIIRSISSGNFTIQNNQGGTTGTALGIILGNTTDNVINVDGGGNIIINSNITGSTGHLTINNTNTGDLRLRGTNSFVEELQLMGPPRKIKLMQPLRCQHQDP